MKPEHYPKDLPKTPGCYLFRDAKGKVLYVGKAKRLKDRVRNYFQNPEKLSPKIRVMVAKAKEVEFFTANHEKEALVLENNLIKEHQPFFNTLLRDDKTYPYVVLRITDDWPKAVFSRKPPADGSLVFGPFAPASHARRHMNIIQRMFQVATCKVTLDGKRNRPCLYYHLDQCLAPCVSGLVSKEKYQQAVQQVRLYLEGRTEELEDRLTNQMDQAADQQRYEDAAHLRDLLSAVQALSQPQKVEVPGLSQKVDFAALHFIGACATLEIFRIRRGRLLARRCFHMREQDIQPAQLMEEALNRFYGRDLDLPEKLVLSHGLPDKSTFAPFLEAATGRKFKVITRPQKALRSFLHLCQENAKEHFTAHFVRKSDHHPTLEQLSQDLDLDNLPMRIEGFDISHVQGAETVASCVVFTNGVPEKKEYRTMNIQGLEGPDDFASLDQAVTRHYRRRLEEGKELPDLILIDGGLGQWGAAHRALVDLGLESIPHISLAKREELLYNTKGEALALDHRRESLKLLQRVRDESHRFAVSRHRRRRSKRTLHSSLLDIPGIGKKTAQSLLSQLGSLTRVKQANRENLDQAIGPAKGKIVWEHFNEPKKKQT